MKIVNAYYNTNTNQFFYDSEFSANKLITPNQDCRYRNITDGRIYVWNGKTYVDGAFFADYQYAVYDDKKYISKNEIYLALPGHRILGVINGVQEDSVSLVTKLNNTSELNFEVDRIIDGEVTQFYDLIQRHYELYIQGCGWFKITEEPEIENDGTQEIKSVVAESNEIELQQYDLVEFMINTGDYNSREMLATDNTYEYKDLETQQYVGYNMFRDMVRFYWDTTELEMALADFGEHTDGSVEALQEYAEEHRFLIHQPSPTNPNVFTGCWRITLDPDSGDVIIDPTRWLTEEEAKQGVTYPDYTGLEILEMELKREHELSLMWLILHEHGWNVGYVDPYIDSASSVPGDNVRLADKSDTFEVDSQDIYSFLTQDMTERFRCIFIFDTDNYLVNCYNINNIGYDTNIFLSYRNLQNELKRTGQEDLYTVFHVQGADKLDFTEVNFGSDSIEDISHFLNTNHFSKEFLEKYRIWADYREGRRTEFINLSKDYRDAYQIAQELYDRVPVDSLDGTQYSSMNEDELFTERDNMLAIKRAIEREFTDEHGNIDWEALENSSEWSQYHALTDVVLSYPYVSDDPIDPIDPLYEVEFWQDPTRSDKYEYRFNAAFLERFPDARLGNIDIAILNKWIITGRYVTDDMPIGERMKRLNVRNKKEYLDTYKYDFARYGHMYGVAELETQLKTLWNALETLRTTGFDTSSDDYLQSEAYKKYVKYLNGYNSCLAVLTDRQAEYDDAMNVVKGIQLRRTAITTDVAITNPQFGMTYEDLFLLDKYYIHTDYQNENILITDQFSNEEIIDAEIRLYQDALEQLYVESHPQYTWSVTQDNLLLMPEFINWHSELHVGNFVWITFRDDYNVKLRISEITFNPLMVDPNITINFSTMTQYRSKRNDYTDLLARANSSTKNQITAAINRTVNNKQTINVDSDLLLRLLNSTAFSTYTLTSSANTEAEIANASLRGEQITSGTVNTNRLNVSEIISSGQNNIENIINDAYVENIIDDNYIRSSVVNNVAVSDLASGDITLSTNDKIKSGDNPAVILMTKSGITSDGVPNKTISDPKLNFMLVNGANNVWSVTTIPDGSQDTFASTLVACINSLVQYAASLETRIAALES